jgi:hypothetical protein
VQHYAVWHYRPQPRIGSTVSPELDLEANQLQHPR